MKSIKVVYHERYRQLYAGDPAAKPGRIEAIYNELYEHGYDFVEPDPASDEELLLVHTPDLINRVKSESTYQIARLAAGGAIRAAELALAGEAAFGLIRPPGHHAGANFSGGFCRFNNMAIAIEKLRQEGKIKSALILDIDLHYGNGTEDIFAGRPDILFLNMMSAGRERYLQAVSDSLASHRGYDILAVSAGFDTYEKDWGGILRTEDFKTVGQLIKEAAKTCDGKHFALLEGGYYIPDLGKNVLAFFEGLE